METHNRNEVPWPLMPSPLDHSHAAPASTFAFSPVLSDFSKAVNLSAEFGSLKVLAGRVSACPEVTRRPQDSRNPRYLAVRRRPLVRCEATHLAAKPAAATLVCLTKAPAP